MAAFKASSSRMMGTDAAERDFGGEVALESRAYWWHEKHKPRKPKYFNRVHTGWVQCVEVQVLRCAGDVCVAWAAMSMHGCGAGNPRADRRNLL